MQEKHLNRAKSIEVCIRVKTKLSSGSAGGANLLLISMKIDIFDETLFMASRLNQINFTFADPRANKKRMDFVGGWAEPSARKKTKNHSSLFAREKNFPTFNYLSWASLIPFSCEAFSSSK